MNIVLLATLVAALGPGPQTTASTPATVQSTESGYRVRGRVYPDASATVGSPVEGFPSPSPPPRGNVAEITGTTQAGSDVSTRVVIDPGGLFEFTSIPPGRYRVTIVPKTSLDPIDIRIVGRDLDVRFGQALVAVSGSVSVEDGGPPPPFELRFIADGVLRNHARVPGVLAVELPPGSYRLVAEGLPAGFSVRSIARGGIDVGARGLQLADSAPAEIAITLRAPTPAPWVRFSGQALRSPDNPFTTVALSGERAGGSLTARVNPDGSFEFPRVLPGSYVVRPLPSSVDLSQTVVIPAGGVTGLRLTGPRAQDIAGEFVPIAPGEFMMGCAGDDVRCRSDERPSRHVAITHGFQIGKYEVTQKQWEAVMGEVQSRIKGDDLPIDGVTWSAAQEFIARLNGLGGEYRYRLLTEAEWEYAARAGSSAPDPDATSSSEFGWFSGFGGRLQPVGGKRPNAWGVYDMRGNVGEWVQDWYDNTYYFTGPALDPAGPLTGSVHPIRGGQVQLDADKSRVSSRDFGSNASTTAGFRLARERRP